MILRHDHLLEVLHAGETEFIIRLHLGRRGIAVEVAPVRLRGQGDRFQRAASGDLDAHRNRVADADRGGRGGHRDLEVADHAVEGVGHILPGQRQHAHGERLARDVRGTLLILLAAEEAEGIAPRLRIVHRQQQGERGLRGAERELPGARGGGAHFENDQVVNHVADLCAALAGLWSLAHGKSIRAQLRDAHILRVLPVEVHLHGERLADIDLLAPHDQLHEGKIGLGRGGGAGGEHLHRNRLRAEDASADAGLKRRDDHVAFLRRLELIIVNEAHRLLAIGEADLVALADAGEDGEIGQRRERRRGGGVHPVEGEGERERLADGHRVAIHGGGEALRAQRQRGEREENRQRQAQQRGGLRHKLESAR